MEARVSEDELQRRLASAQALVAVDALYRHYKGNIYQVVGLAILESTNEACVVYQAQYGKRLTFVRPLLVWLEMVEVDGQTMQRFTRLLPEDSRQ